MTSPTVPRNAYTDAPELHPNMVLGSLQIYFWIFFHPSAWRNYVATIDSTLSPDFCLVKLSQTQWRDPRLRRLVVAGYVVYPLVMIALITLAMHGLPLASETIVYQLMFLIVVSVIVDLAVGTAGSIAFWVAAPIATLVAIFIAIALHNSVPFVVMFNATGTMSIGIASTVKASMLGNSANQRSFSFARQTFGIIVSALFGCAAIGVASAAGKVSMNILPRSFTIILGNSKELSIMFDTANTILAGVLASTSFGIIVARFTGKWFRGATYGLVSGLVCSLIAGAATAMTSVVGLCIEFGILFGVLFTFAYVIAESIAGPRAGVIAGTLGSGGGIVTYLIVQYNTPFVPVLLVSLAISILLGLTRVKWQPILFDPFLEEVWNRFLYHIDERRSSDRPILFRWHSAFWNELQSIRLNSLTKHLTLVISRKPSEAQSSLNYLANSRQSWVAGTILRDTFVQYLESCMDLNAVRQAHVELIGFSDWAGSGSALFRNFGRISQDIDAALSQDSTYNQRLALSAAENHLDKLVRDLASGDDQYTVRFYRVAERWRYIVADCMRQLAETVEQHQEIESPYITGTPLTERQEIFVGRADIIARIEHMLLDQRRPPLLLYGQRRMGKTSLLNNLGRLLPSTIVPLFVDLQGPAAQSSNHTGFLYNVARGMIDSASRQRSLALPPLPREALEADPFTRFDEWLDEIEEVLGQNTVLLALDEFEALDNAITKGRFEEERVLGMLRHLIQHRPRFKVLLAGSHTLDELQRWASYLINVQVVQISYLKEAEARQLVERPVKDFALCYEPDASQRVLDLTRGHPFLVQLLCAEIVALKNEQEPAVRRLAHLGDVDAAVPEALSHGSFFFADIERNQVNADGLALLRFVAAQGDKATIDRQVLARQFPDPAMLDSALGLCLRRELIEPADGGYHFQVELIRRWFARQVK